MRFNIKITAILVLVIGLTAQGTVFAETLLPSCYLPVIGCQMQNCPMAKAMQNGGQKMDCCKSTADKNSHSEALPTSPKNTAAQGLEFAALSPSHVGLEQVSATHDSEFTAYKSPHDPEPLYEKNQDLRL